MKQSTLATHAFHDRTSTLLLYTFAQFIVCYHNNVFVCFVVVDDVFMGHFSCSYESASLFLAYGVIEPYSFDVSDSFESIYLLFAPLPACLI